jgi:hypothetical protein
MTDTNSGRGIGDNRPPNAAYAFAQLAVDYRHMSVQVDDLLDAARELPKEIDDDVTMGSYATLIKKFRDCVSKLEGLRILEKEPHLRAGQAVDSFFGRLCERCCRKDRKARPGAADVLQSRLDEYNQRKLAEERERRNREAEEKLRLAREAQEKSEREDREAAEARVAAARARNPEVIAIKGAAATAAYEAATASAINSQLAADQAREAYIATLARPADIIRTRVEEGPLITMATEGYADVVDATALDAATLWPFVTLAAKESALRAWARNVGYTQQMAGASVGKRQKSVVR